MPNSFPGRDAGLRHVPLACLILLALILFAVVALPPSSRAVREQVPTSPTKGKRTRPEFVPGEVLVRYRSEGAAKRQPRSNVLKNSVGRELAIQVERFQGSEIVAGLRLARVPPDETMAAIEALRKQPDVLYAEPNYIVRADLTPNDPCFPPNSLPGCQSTSLYGLTKIAAPQAWDTTTGSSTVVVGVIDEGIDLNHQDLQANVWINPSPGSIPGISGDVNGYNFADNTGTIPAEEHATHVAGIVGAKGNNGIGVVGVNWNVSLMSLRVLGSSGGSDSDLIGAYNYAKQMRELWVSSGGSQGANVRVLNNSYGGGGFSQAIFDAIDALRQPGILFVGSAGNDGPGSSGDSDSFPHYPSGYDLPNVISVASTNSGDQLTPSSNFGAQTVTLGAPGDGILSTTPSNTYVTLGGTSMASPHVAGAAALICAANPSVTLQQLKALLIFNGDVLPALQGKTLTGRRLNVAKSFQALAENDVTAPGMATNLRVNTQSGRSITLAWTASGDDGASGQASLYELNFTDGVTGAVIALKSVIPVSSGSQQTLDVKLPYRHTVGTVTLREFDNVGNEGTPATLNVSVPLVEGDPYATTLSIPVGLSTGGTLLPELNFDDRYKENHPLPFSFPFFGQTFNTVTISTNGNLYFSPPPKRPNGDADDVPGAAAELSKHKMISGLWDDIYLGTDQRSDAGVYTVQPDSSRLIFRWQGVPCNSGPSGACDFGGAPINFEIELRNDGQILTRYGSGNTNIFPVVGIGGGEPEAYTISSHTSEQSPTSLTDALQVIFLPRAAANPLENAYFFVSQHYRDFLDRDPDSGGLAYWSNEITKCGSDPVCIKNRRVAVSAAFFVELEFQRTGSYVYRLYQGGLARHPSFQEFNADRAQVVEGPNLEATKQALALAFVQRMEFVTKYTTNTTPESFVDALIASILQESQVDLNAQRSALIAKYSTGANMNEGRALALRDAIDNAAFVNDEFNAAFVLMQYFGYLHRDPDQDGYNFWLGIVNDPTKSNYHSMVCAFITSPEYQQRYSPLVPRNDNECAGIQP